MPPTLSIDRHSTTDTIHTWYGVVHLFDRKKMEKQVRCCGSLNLNPQHIESCWEKGCSSSASSPSVCPSVRLSVCLSGGQEYKRTHARTYTVRTSHVTGMPHKRMDVHVYLPHGESTIRSPCRPWENQPAGARWSCWR